MVTLDEILRQRREESERQTRSQSGTTQTTDQTESRTMDDILATGTSNNSNNDSNDSSDLNDSNYVFTTNNQMLAEIDSRGLSYETDSRRLRYETHLPEDNNLEVNTEFVTFDSVLDDLYKKDPEAMLARDSQLRVEELASQVIDYSNKVREEETFKKLGLFNSIKDTETVSTKVSHTKITLDI